MAELELGIELILEEEEEPLYEVDCQLALLSFDAEGH